MLPYLNSLDIFAERPLKLNRSPGRLLGIMKKCLQWLHEGGSLDLPQVNLMSF